MSKRQLKFCACGMEREEHRGLKAEHRENIYGPIALVKNGDTITIDAEKRELTLEIPWAELKKRKKSWKKPAPRYTRGVLAKYAAHVTSASLGAVTDAELEL